MEITGKIIKKLEPVSGTSKAGNAWNKQEYVLETLDAYPRKVFFNFFGERANQYPMEVGQLVTVSFDLESREFNGRWYTDVRAWKSEPYVAGQPQAAAAPQPQVMGQPIPQAPQPAAPAAPTTQVDFTQPAEGDDLPF